MRVFGRYQLGLSLLELLVVIGIIAIITAISIPLWSSFKRNAQLSSQAEMIVSDLREMQQNTVSIQRKHEMKLDLANNNYTLIRRDPDPNGGPDDYLEVIIKTVNLVNNVSFDPDATTISDVVFISTGAVDQGGNIVVKDTQGKAKTIEIKNSGVIHIQ